MMSFFILADIDFQSLVWIVLFFVWMIAQIAAQLNKAKRPPPTQHRRPPPTPERREEPEPSLQDDLREIFESITGVRMEEEKEEAEVEIRRPEPPSPPVRKPPPVPILTRRVEPEPEDDEENAFEEQEETIAKFSYDALPDQETPNRLVNPASFMVGLSSLKTPIMKVPLTTSHKISTSGLKPKIKNSRELKKAMIHRILLGPPVGMQDELGSNLDPWRQ